MKRGETVQAPPDGGVTQTDEVLCFSGLIHLTKRHAL